jgi:hypothetical protein
MNISVISFSHLVETISKSPINVEKKEIVIVVYIHRLGTILPHLPGSSYICCNSNFTIAASHNRKPLNTLQNASTKGSKG